MKRVFEVSADIEVIIEQEYTGDVNSVVWDSAIAAIYSFIQQGRNKWECKKVIELGAGTGAAGLVVAALGADVVLTDLPEYVPLLERNLAINQYLHNSVTVAALDWLSFSSNPVLSSKYDVILMIDCIYYSSVIPGLLQLLKTVECQEIICIFEKRDIGEPVAAQELFLKLVHKEFEVFSIDKSELHPEWICDEIIFLRLIKKLV